MPRADLQPHNGQHNGQWGRTTHSTPRAQHGEHMWRVKLPPKPQRLGPKDKQLNSSRLTEGAVALMVEEQEVVEEQDLLPELEVVQMTHPLNPLLLYSSTPLSPPTVSVGARNKPTLLLPRCCSSSFRGLEEIQTSEHRSLPAGRLEESTPPQSSRREQKERNLRPSVKLHCCCPAGGGGPRGGGGEGRGGRSEGGVEGGGVRRRG